MNERKIFDAGLQFVSSPLVGSVPLSAKFVIKQCGRLLPLQELLRDLNCCVCVAVIVKFMLEIRFLLQVGDLYSKEGIEQVGSACSCRGLYATIDTEVVWSQKYELDFPGLIHPFRMTLLRDIRTCTKSGKFVSSSKLGFSNFMYYAGLHSLLIQRVAMETETCSSKGTCWGATHAEGIFLHIKISCCMELAEFFALGVCFYKNM